MSTLKDKVEKLAEAAIKADKSEDAMRFAQAAQNMAHAYATLRGADQLKE